MKTRHALATIVFQITCWSLTSFLPGCASQQKQQPAVFPKNFKVRVPFIVNGRGIIVNTYWGTKRKHHVLCIDNHSPSWIKRPLVQYDQSFIRSEDQTFKTASADGTAIKGEIGICDTLRFEGVTFTDVPFYVIPENAKENTSDDGVFGIELLKKGILKIDFGKSELTFASAPDSIENIYDAEIFPATFTNEKIAVDVSFGNKVLKKMAVDLGFNGDFLLPAGEFKDISEHKKTFIQTKQFTTPASFNIVNSTSVFDTVKIDHSWFIALISSSHTVTERLIGLQFFKRFDYVIFDFINRRIYLPKKIW